MIFFDFQNRGPCLAFDWEKFFLASFWPEAISTPNIKSWKGYL